MSYSLKLAPVAVALVALNPSWAHAQATSAEVELPPMVVTATMSEHETITAPASATVISREELDTRNPDNLLDAVRGEQGITLAGQTNGGRKTITMRGMEGRHVLTLIDGRRISASDDIVGHSDYQYGWVPMSAVEQVEIIRGPMSTLYGSEALGGVVNMITRKPTDHWEGSISVTGATLSDESAGDSVNLGVYGAGPLNDRLSLRLNGEFIDTDAIPSTIDPNSSALEGREHTNGGLGATLKLSESQSLDFDYYGGREERFYDASKSVSGQEVYYENRYILDRSHASLGWNGEFDQWRGQLRAYRSEIEIENEPSNGVSPTSPQSMDDDVVDGFVSRRFGAHQLTAGGEYRDESLTHATLIGEKDNATHQALFVQDELDLGSTVTLTGGLRVDDHELFGNEVSPRLYLVWEPSGDLVIKGGYGHAFKAPTLKQISPNYHHEGSSYDVLGNPDLEPETLDAFELSANWQVGDVNLNGTVFYNDVQDLISSTKVSPAGATRSVYRYMNVDEARITGLETGLIWDINDSVAWTTNATFLSTEDRATGEDLEYRPETSVTSYVDWFGPSGWSSRAGLVYTGSQHTASEELPGYTMWNASIAREFGSRYTLRAGVENIGDMDLEEESPEFKHAERGRTMFVTLRADF